MSFIRGTTQFLIVLVATAVIICHLCPRQAPLQQVSSGVGEHKSVTLLPASDERVAKIREQWRDYDRQATSKELAMAKWHRDLASHYIATAGHHSADNQATDVYREQHETAEHKVRQVAAYLDRSRGAPPKFRLGPVLENQPYKITLVFALLGGLIMALGYAHWRQEYPSLNPSFLQYGNNSAASTTADSRERHSQDQINQVRINAEWFGIRQSIGVQARRVALVTLVILAIMIMMG